MQMGFQEEKGKPRVLITTKNIFEIKKLKTLFSSEFDMKDLSATKKILGMGFTGIDAWTDCSCHRKIIFRGCLSILVCRSVS